jgi:tyrosyl-DNA phosphodiesterase-1
MSRRRSPATTVLIPTWGFDDVSKQTPSPASPVSEGEQVADANVSKDDQGHDSLHYATSPIQLTRIEDMPPHQNVDAVSLKDILGHPMIKECWNFNYLFDLDFVMLVLADSSALGIRVYLKRKD